MINISEIIDYLYKYPTNKKNFFYLFFFFFNIILINI